MRNVLRTHTDRTSTILLIVLAGYSLLSFGVTYTVQTMAQDISASSVETRFWPGWGQDVTLIRWQQLPTNPSLTYTRVWRIGLNEQNDSLIVTNTTSTLEVGYHTRIEATHTGSACYVLEQGSGPDHQPRRLVWLGCVR